MSNVGNCYQQIKFSKYLSKQIIEDIRPTVQANTENTILHTNQSLFLNGCAFVHLRFNVFQIPFQQLHSDYIFVSYILRNMTT
jgi:hypothetical protein